MTTKVTIPKPKPILESDELEAQHQANLSLEEMVRLGAVQNSILVFNALWQYVAPRLRVVVRFVEI